MSVGLRQPSGNSARLADLLNRFSVALTEVVDRQMGTDYARNAELRAIVALQRHGSHTRAALADVAGLSPRAFASFVRRLQARGIVDVTADPADRRAVLVGPTRAGRRAFRALADALDHVYADTQPLSKEIVDLLTSQGHPAEMATTEPFEMLDRIAIVGLELQAAINAQPHGAEVAGRQEVAVLGLADGGSARPTQLAELLVMTSGGLTYVINQLEARGLVNRDYGSDPRDRRAVSISLTDHGRAVATSILAGISDTAPRLVELFTQLRDRPSSQPSGETVPGDAHPPDTGAEGYTFPSMPGC